MPSTLHIDAEDIKRELPHRFDPNKLTQGHLQEACEEATGVLHSITNEKYYPFNGHDATPPTPKRIKRYARELGVAFTMQQFGRLYSTGGILKEAREAERLARQDIEHFIRDDRSLPNESAAGYVPTFGGDASRGWELGDDEAFLFGSSPLQSADEPTPIVDTVRITSATGLDNGTDLRPQVDFYVQFHPLHKRWIFRSNVVELYNGTVTSLALAFEWSYLRRVGKPRQVGGKLSLA